MAPNKPGPETFSHLQWDMDMIDAVYLTLADVLFYVLPRMCPDGAAECLDACRLLAAMLCEAFDGADKDFSAVIEGSNDAPKVLLPW